ncbi:MAG TPA: hypothetical protein VJW94_06705 [Candidatus Acidoferrum sp.]|nr:hypothetical protein [Candidatus Acidoferrum sp.]
MLEGTGSETSANSAIAPPRANARKRTDAAFYLVMALASTCLVFLGFARTYYLKPFFGTPSLRPLLHLHGVVFTVWMLIFVTQTALIASNRRALHRRLGYAAGVFACAMVVLGLLVAFSAERLGHGNSLVDAETVFLISLGDILTFVVFLGAGFLWRRNPEAHQRLMLLAVVAGLLSAAIPRLPLIGGHPPAMGITGLAFLFAGPIYDLITRHRIHPAYLWGCLFSLATFVPVRIAVAATPAWHHVAKWLVGG